MKRHPSASGVRRHSAAEIVQLRLMTSAARMHHIHGARQTEIAGRLGFSQAGASRLLRIRRFDARASKLVKRGEDPATVHMKMKLFGCAGKARGAI